MTSDGKHAITVDLPPALRERLDSAARHLNRRRTEIIRQAVERYLEDFDDVIVASERRRDRTDPVLDWDLVRGGLLR